MGKDDYIPYVRKYESNVNEEMSRYYEKGFSIVMETEYYRNRTFLSMFGNFNIINIFLERTEYLFKTLVIERELNEIARMNLKSMCKRKGNLKVIGSLRSVLLGDLERWYGQSVEIFRSYKIGGNYEYLDDEKRSNFRDLREIGESYRISYHISRTLSLYNEVLKSQKFKEE